MDGSGTASAAVQRDAPRGMLPAVARQALAPRLERIQSALRVRELQAGDAGVQQTNPRPGVSAGVTAARKEIAPAARPLPLTPSQQSVPQREPEGRDGASLRQVQLELRALRADITQLSRALGFTSRDSNRTDYKGILQQRDGSDSDVRLRRWRNKDSVRQARISATTLRQEAARISQRQRELLRALRRAEQRLAQAPDNLPPGLRDGILGEIYRALHSIAQFGGANGMAQLSGLEYDNAA